MKSLKNGMSIFKLSKTDKKSTTGGRDYVRCCCACAYENLGGSSSDDNFSANKDGGEHGLVSPECFPEN